MKTVIVHFTRRAAKALVCTAVLIASAARGAEGDSAKSRNAVLEKAFIAYLANHEAGAAVFVEAPAGAKVTVEGQNATYTFGNFSGAYFEAPDANKLYFANVRVVYANGGKTIEEKKRARMFPGKINWLDYTDIASPDKKKRTVAYWNEAHNIINDTSVLVPGMKTSADVSVAFAHVAAELDALPVRGVDEDAVSAISDLSSVYVKALKANEANGSAGRLLEAGVIRNRRDLVSILRESVDQNKAVVESFNNSQAQMKKTGRVLSARYEVELTVP